MPKSKAMCFDFQQSQQILEIRTFCLKVRLQALIFCKISFDFGSQDFLEKIRLQALIFCKISRFWKSGLFRKNKDTGFDFLQNQQIVEIRIFWKKVRL